MRRAKTSSISIPPTPSSPATIIGSGQPHESSGKHTGKAPFDTVRIHGIVRDSQAARCQDLGNGIDPLEVIAQYGADALRFMLVDGSTPAWQ